MNLEGKVIGSRYEILEKIGMGGMATVYKAKDNILKRYVAIKILRDEFTTDEEFIKRFNTEAQSAASLTHPNIVSIYDVGQEDNIYYIVMELIKGKTLKDIINEDGVLPWKWSVNIAMQIASALETAHRNNIVHRDIKPHNIIITEDGIAKVTDFGIAKAVSNSTITAFGTTIGSVHYFSPEHAKGGYTDAKSDLYSLGVVIYEMVTGRVPFDADTPVSIALKHMQEKPVEPIKLNPSIPYSVNKIIMKAMEKDVSLRYQSATEMLKDLSMALKNPEGHFVEYDPDKIAYTQRVPTIGEEQLNKEDKDIENKEPEKKKGYFAKHPKAKKVLVPLIIILAIILVPVLGYFGAKWILSAGVPDDIQVPELVGKTLEEAQELIKDTEIVLTTEERNDDEVEAGKIISQDPEYKEGYTIKENAEIKVVVSKGPEIAEVIKVVGETFEEAENKIKALGLNVEKIEETSQTVEAGIVTRQDPEEGTELKAGDTVKLYVSIGTGIKQVVVPYTIGDTEEDAKKKLTEAGLEVTAEYREDTSKSDGTVLEQSIDSGNTVDEGTKITIVVNKIEKIKQGTVNINLKSLINKPIEKDENGNVIDPEVVLDVRVNEESVYKENHRKDETNIVVPVSGKGTITIKVFVNDVREAQVQMDLNTTTTLNID